MAIREPFPLSWPEGWTRTKWRKHARFSASFTRARNDVYAELKRIFGANISITSNVSLNHRGVPDGRTATPSDPGVAVWWQEKGGVERVIACDKWLTPAENLQAIVKTLEALRGIDRWGASQIVERAFAGFTALPAGGETHKEPDWWEVLDINPSIFEALTGEQLLFVVKGNYKKLSAITHPDHGGSSEQMTAISVAYERAEHFCKNKDTQ